MKQEVQKQLHSDETQAVGDRPAASTDGQPSNRHSSFSSGLKKWLVRSLVLGTAVGTSAILGASAVLFTPLANQVTAEREPSEFSVLDLWRKGFSYEISRPITILVMGIDEVPNADVESAPTSIFDGRSDTMLLLRIDPDSNALNVLSIPRDTQIEIPALGVTKINHANAMGGPQLASDVISANLNGVEIDRYVRINTNAFREFVDLLGGVEVLVPYDMQYTDQTQGLEIDLKQGRQVLDGDQAEQFARFRGDGQGDIGRVQRQQQLIQGLRDRVANPGFLTRVPRAIELLQTYTDTNLSLEEILALADFGATLDRDQFRMVMLPGRFSTANEFIASYWLVDTVQRDRVMADYFDVNVPYPVSRRDRPLRNLHIAIQNASSYPYQAQEVADYLYSQGFNNVYVVPDWPSAQNDTEIVVQRGHYDKATDLERVLGIGRVIAASTGDLESDLTIRVGDDWRNRIAGDRLDS